MGCSDDCVWGESMANDQKSLKSNVVYSAVLSVANLIFPLITFPYITRVLSPEGIGKINFANSIISYFIMVVMLGIPSYGMREVARRSKDKKQLSVLVEELLIINTILLVVCYAVYFAIVLFIPRFSQDKKLYFLFGVQILFNVLGVEWFYRGMESFKYITCRSIITKIISFVLVFACVKDESDLFIYAVITVVANVGAYLLNFCNLRKYHLEFVEPSALNIKQHIAPLLILFTTAIATNISTQVDTTMLGFIHGDEAVGYYSIAVKVKNILVALTGAVGTAVFPRLVAMSKNKKEYVSLANEVYLYLMLLTVPATVFFYEYAEKAVLILAGHEYLAAVQPMKIITITVFLVTFSCLFGGRILVSLNRAEVQLHSVIWGTVVNCLANLLLIPKLGVTGAAIATVLSESTVLIYCVIAIPKEYKISFAPIDTMKIFISSILAVFCAKTFVFPIGDNMLIQFASDIIEFGVVYVILLVILREKIIVKFVGIFFSKIKKK